MKKNWAIAAMVTSVCFLLTVGTFSTAGAADNECKDFLKQFNKTADKYGKVLKKIGKIVSNKNFNVGKLNRQASKKETLVKKLKRILKENENNKEKCAKQWKIVDKLKKKFGKMEDKNIKLYEKNKG